MLSPMKRGTSSRDFDEWLDWEAFDRLRRTIKVMKDFLDKRMEPEKNVIYSVQCFGSI